MFNDILFVILKFSFEYMHLKMSSEKRRPLCQAQCVKWYFFQLNARVLDVLAAFYPTIALNVHFHIHLQRLEIAQVGFPTPYLPKKFSGHNGDLWLYKAHKIDIINVYTR